MAVPASSENTKRVVADLGRSELVRDYLRDFGELAGVTVDFRSGEKWPPCNSGEACRNPFCALLVNGGGLCTACLEVEHERSEPCAVRSVKCLGDMRETAVPVVLERNIIAYLVIHPVIHFRPTKKAFIKALTRLRQRGIACLIKKLEATYLAIPAMSAQKHEVVVGLLSTFAKHLALRAQEMMLLPATNESPGIVRARDFIAKHQAEKLSLTAVAKAAHMNPVYFCRVFKKATGVGFSEYLSRLRIERAKWLLRDRRSRISEVAFAVGFGSMAQFNRSFKKVVGQSPSTFRSIEGQPA